MEGIVKRVPEDLKYQLQNWEDQTEDANLKIQEQVSQLLVSAHLEVQ